MQGTDKNSQNNAKQEALKEGNLRKMTQICPFQRQNPRQPRLRRPNVLFFVSRGGQVVQKWFPLLGRAEIEIFPRGYARHRRF
jgi:hypothetical protein